MHEKSKNKPVPEEVDVLKREIADLTRANRQLRKEIDQRTAAESLVRQERDNIRQYIDLAGVIFVVLDTEGIVRLINRKGCSLVGLGQEEIIGRNWIDTFIPEAEREEAGNVLRKLLKSGTLLVEYHEASILTAGEKERIIAWHHTVLANIDGSIAGILSSGKDITKHRQAQDALKASEEKYRILFQASSDAIFLVDVETLNILDANEKAEILFGYSRNELLNLKATALSAEPQKTQSNIHTKKLSMVPLRYAKKKDGTVFPIEISANYFTLNDRGINISSIRDISETQKIEMRLIQAQKMESIGVIAGGIAHDFNNILTGIMGFAELAQLETPEGSTVKEDLQEILRASYRAKDLVKQILAFARQSDEKVKPVQVSIIAKEVMKLIRSTLPATIDIRSDIQSTSLIMGNPGSLHQIFMNICTNAAQAMEDNGGIMTISIMDTSVDVGSMLSNLGLLPKEYVQIEVSDTGTGIHPSLMESIFEPYFTTKKTSEGTGMGLSVVHGIVEEYGGKIFADSSPGNGATFTIYLPITKKRGEILSGEQETFPRGDEHILLVDDELTVVRVIERALQRLGYKVSARTSSIEALALFRARPEDFDLVVTDMTMPNMTGDLLAMEMMAVRPDIPVILLTGYTKKLSKQDALGMGIKAFAYKPVVLKTLATTIRNVLES